MEAWSQPGFPNSLSLSDAEAVHAYPGASLAVPPPATPPSLLPWPLCDLATSTLRPAADPLWNGIPAKLLTSRCLISKAAVKKNKPDKETWACFIPVEQRWKVSEMRAP